MTSTMGKDHSGGIAHDVGPSLRVAELLLGFLVGDASKEANRQLIVVQARHQKGDLHLLPLLDAERIGG